MSSIMSIKLKVLSVLVAVSLLGCTGNSETESLVPSTDLKRFSGVINNSSVIGAEIVARPIGKHGKFALDINGVEEAIAKEVDEYGRYHFNVEIEDRSPYILTVFTPYLNPDPKTEEEIKAAEAYKAAKASCQLVEGCDTGDETVGFGEFYSLKPSQQLSAAVESVSEGQFVVIKAITEMASTLGSTIYINDALAVTETIGGVPAANYYSNYGIVKGNSQTARVVGIGDILSREPANLALLHKLNTNASTAIEESIRYGALLAAWQKLELEYDRNLAEGKNTFQQEVVGQFLDNQGQLQHKGTSPSSQVLTLENWFTAAYENLEKVRDYHKGLNRTLPGEIELVITKFKAEIDSLVDGQSTAAEPVVNDYYLEDYADAVTKTKAMVNYLSNLQSNFATEEYRTSIKASSDLVTAETRRLSPSLDQAFQKILSIYQYYLTCTHGECDTQSEWHSADGSAGNTFVASEDKLTIIKAEGSSLAGTNLVVTQGLVFDETNPEGSLTSYTHDLFLSGVIVFDDIRLELSDFTSEDTDGIKSSVRFSFREKLEKLPPQPEKVAGGMGASINENLVPDYIELVFPQFTLFDPSQKDTGNEVKVTGSLTSLMIANTDVGDFVDEKPEVEKLGKRYNLSSVRATIVASGGSKGEVADDDGVIQLRDNAIFFLDASASESFVSGTNSTAYFPDTVYPTFENFFKPRNGYEVGHQSPYPLVISRLGTMVLPKLDAENELVEGESVEVQYIELDYELGGLERYIVYPKVEGEDQYLGIICSAGSEDEKALAETDGFTIPLVDSEGNPVLDDDGNQRERSLMECPYREMNEGDATPENFINQVHTKTKNLVTLREYNGQGVYRIDYLDNEGKLKEFTHEASHYGKIEVPVVLGVDSMRLQFKPNLVNQAGTGYLPQSILDVSLVWRTRDVIQVNVLMAFDAEHVINHQTGSGLPYLAAGSDSESYSVAYIADAEGNESGEYVMAWAGVEFIDGPVKGTKILQKTEDEQTKEGLFAGIGSNVSYSPYSNGELEEFGNNASEEKCGFFSRGATPTVGEDCDAIAYLTFRGLVTGSLREERDGVYVIRYIDGSWQVLGGS